MGGSIQVPRIRTKNLVRFNLQHLSKSSFSCHSVRVVSKSKSSFSFIVVASFSIIFCEAVAIYGIIMAAVLQTKVAETAGRPVTNHDFYAGFGIFWAGVTVGLCNLACGY
jgi:V-type H+-transporting ATPase proteolipid subunit